MGRCVMLQLRSLYHHFPVCHSRTNQADSPRSTALHATIHELIRLSTLPLIISPTTSGFHSSYYLGLGWGAAEAAWGIVQGWDQLALYEDVMKPEAGDEERSSGKVETEDEIDGGEGLLDLVTIQEARDVDDEVDLERKVEILERMRARRGEWCSEYGG